MKERCQTFENKSTGEQRQKLNQKKIGKKKTPRPRLWLQHIPLWSTIMERQLDKQDRR